MYSFSIFIGKFNVKHTIIELLLPNLYFESIVEHKFKKS